MKKIESLVSNIYVKYTRLQTSLPPMNRSLANALEKLLPNGPPNPRHPYTGSGIGIECNCKECSRYQAHRDSVHGFTNQIAGSFENHSRALNRLEDNDSALSTEIAIVRGDQSKLANEMVAMRRLVYLLLFLLAITWAILGLVHLL